MTTPIFRPIIDRRRRRIEDREGQFPIFFFHPDIALAIYVSLLLHDFSQIKFFDKTIKLIFFCKWKNRNNPLREFILRIFSNLPQILKSSTFESVLAFLLCVFRVIYIYYLLEPEKSNANRDFIVHIL